jgi:drug/metabolite transporter (DMT)-like permease
MKKGTAHIMAVVAMLFWGMSFIWTKIVFETYSPVTTIFIRLIISVVVLFLFVLITRRYQRIKKKDFRYFFLSSLFNPFLYFIGENYGLQHVSASLTAVIISTIPVITPFIVVFFYNEKLTRLNFGGLLLSFAGVLIIIFSDRVILEGNFLGLIFLLMAVVSSIFYTIFVKKLSVTYKPVNIIMWQNLIGVFLFFPLFLAFDIDETITVVPGQKTILSLVMLGIFASSAAFILYVYAIKHLGIIKTNLYTNLIPVFAFLFAFMFLGEKITLLRIVGLVIVLFGIILSEINRGKELQLKHGSENNENQ